MSKTNQWATRVKEYLQFHEKRCPYPAHFVVGTDQPEPTFRQGVPGMVVVIYQLNSDEAVPSGDPVELFIAFPDDFTVEDVREAVMDSCSLNVLVGITSVAER